jgi:hypothetical protein
MSKKNMYKKDENGAKGEIKTREKLGDDFWILSRSVDRDGVDLIVQLQKSTPSHLMADRERVNEFGYVQAKYFENNNQVRIARHYVDDQDGVSRKGFFAYLHTHEGHESVNYFFNSAEIQEAWYLDKSGEHYCFSLTTKRTYSEYKNRTRSEVKALIERGVRNLKLSIESLVSNEFYALHSNARSPISPVGHYILTRVHGAAIVVYKDDENSNAMPLDPRKDNFVYAGHFEWGYEGTAPRFLAASILTHLFCDKKPLHDEINRLVGYLLGRLERYNSKDHVITKDMIMQALSCIPYNAEINESHGVLWEIFQSTVKKYQHYFLSED